MQVGVIESANHFTDITPIGGLYLKYQNNR
jgi:hypothetical protein